MRSDAQPAGYGDLAAHHPAQAAADRQSEAGSAEAACRRAVNLHEFAEQALDLLLAHADAGVLQSEDDPLGLAPAFAADVEPDLAGLGELRRVAEQVQQNLTDPRRIGRDLARLVA